MAGSRVNHAALAAWRRRRLRQLPRLDAHIVAIYRARNAKYVSRLLEPVLAVGWGVALWALDEVVDDLAPHTVGAGRGERLALLNRILELSDPGPGWLVVSDDDLIFTRGDVVDLVAICELAGFGLAQPAHFVSPLLSHPITGARPLSVARMTTFVEIGPLFAVAPRWLPRLAPFPEDRGMGWGLELEWRALLDDGCLFGIVDAVTVRHEGAIGSEYDAQLYSRSVKAELAASGVQGWAELQRILATWRPWQRVAPWVTASGRCER